MPVEFKVSDYEDSWGGGEGLYFDLKKAVFSEGRDEVILNFEGCLVSPAFLMASFGQFAADLGPPDPALRPLYFSDVPLDVLTYLNRLSRQIYNAYPI